MVRFTESLVRAIPSTPMITAGPLMTSAPPLKAPGPPRGAEYVHIDLAPEGDDVDTLDAFAASLVEKAAGK